MENFTINLFIDLTKEKSTIKLSVGKLTNLPTN